MPNSWLLGCASGANPFIEKYFYDCVYNLRDYIGFCLGLAAILFWIVAQIPQWVRNFRTKSAEALSPWFLAQWLLGDTFNLLGCLLQGQQLPTTTYTAMYFVVADVFMMMQYIYYGALQRRKQMIMQLQVHRRHHRRRHHHHDSSRSQPGRPDQFQRVAGSDSPKDRTVWQRQRQQQQHEQQQPQQGNSSDSSKQHPLQSEQLSCWQQIVSQQQQAPVASQEEWQQQQRQQQTNSSWQAGTQDAALEACLPQDNAAAVAAGGGVRARLPCSFSHNVVIGGVSLGSYRLVAAVGMLVTMGLVCLAVPASSGVGYVAVSQAAAASVSSTQRLMHAGTSADAQGSIHAGRPHTSSGLADSSIAGPEEPLSLSGVQDSSHRFGDGSGKSITFVVGTMLGYCSSVLYLCSRVSQIHKNYTRKSSEGLSLAMFMMAVCANLCTGTGIVVRTFTWQELKEQLPWIVGSLGTISLDMVILWQSLRYSNKDASHETLPAVATTAAVPVEGHQQQLYIGQHAYQQQHDRIRLGHVGDYVGSATAAAVVTISGASGGVDAAAACASAPAVSGWGILHRRQAQSSSVDRAQVGNVSREDADEAAPLLLAVD